VVRLRLRRMGKRKQPTYRLVACDKRAPRGGSFIEALGHYNPRTEPITISFNEEKVLDWLGKGAEPSDTVQRLLKQVGIWQNFQQQKDVKAVKSEAAEKVAE
jgi:small subunit ribosomal protein S16